MIMSGLYVSSRFVDIFTGNCLLERFIVQQFIAHSQYDILRSVQLVMFESHFVGLSE